MMDEIDTIKRLINTLEERIKELETENRALKSAILNAGDTLTRQNNSTKGLFTVDEKEKIVPLAPAFKQPKWKNK